MIIPCFSTAEYGDAFSLFILRLPEGAAKADAVEYLEKAAAACGGAGPRRLMEYDAECAVLLQQSVSSDSKRFRELASRLDALELPRDTHYLFYERLNGLEEVALAVESLAQVQEQCFFALGTYVSLHLPSPSPKPVSQEELEERVRELHKRLYAGNQFGFITQLKELYCGLLAEHRHLPSCRVAHELIRDVWFSYSEKQEGGLGHDFPMTFEEASSFNDLYADISNHFILAFNHSAADFSDIISCAVGFLQEHCAEPIALAETARFLDVSEPYLSRRFHRETGRTLVDYLNHIRIDRARLLLSSSGHLRVHRVAELCGFSNAHYFALRFKKEVGMTPLEFQKRMRAYLYQGNQEARI